MARRRAPALPTIALAAVSTLLASGCSQVLSLLNAGDVTYVKSLPAWSPYVVVQPNSGAINGYRDALTTMTAHGAVKGVRIGLYADGSSSAVVNLAASLGLEVLGIMDDSDLFRSDLEAAFDQYRAAYPQVKIFQIGNEITTGNPSMSITNYVDVFSRIYAHVVSTYPDVTLLTEATFGAGNIGAGDLTVLVPALKALRVSSARVILGLNVYTDSALTAYAAAVNTIGGGYRVWVTETGVPDQTQQVAYVTTTYPRITALVGAERIYWYALWAGDSGGDSEYSLIKNPSSPPIVPGPLFLKLTTSN